MVTKCRQAKNSNAGAPTSGLMLAPHKIFSALLGSIVRPPSRRKIARKVGDRHILAFLRSCFYLLAVALAWIPNSYAFVLRTG